MLDNLGEKSDLLMDQSISLAAFDDPGASRFRSYVPKKAMMKRREMKKESIFEDDDDAGGELFA